MEDIVQALMAQMTQPRQIEVDEMGMPADMQYGANVQPMGQDIDPTANLKRVAEIIESYKTLKKG